MCIWNLRQNTQVIKKLSGVKDDWSQANEKFWGLKLEMCNKDYSTKTVINILIRSCEYNIKEFFLVFLEN